MISKIILNNVASYKLSSQLNTDKKVNLIYGLNGAGKSTFSNYFWNPGSIEYQHCSHHGEYDQILVYNQKFIQENFYSKDTLNGIFSLSKENKNAQEKVDQLTKELEEIKEKKQKLDKDITDQRNNIKNAKDIAQAKVWEIKTNYTGGDRVLEFCLRGKMGSKESLFNHLSSILLSTTKPIRTIQEIKNDVNAIDGDEAIKQSLFKNIDYLELKSDDYDFLNEIIVGNNDTPISNLINKLQNSDWVNEGIKFLNFPESSECPFCQSKTITQSLVDQINVYFDETYKDNLRKLDKIHTEYDEKINKIPKFDFYRSNSFAKDHLIELSECYKNLEIINEENINLIKKKISNPSFQFVLIESSSVIDSINSVINAINKAINAHNTKIDNVSSELIKIKTEFWSILRFEYNQTIINFTDIEQQANKIITSKQLENNEYNRQKALKDKDRAFHQKSTVHIEDAIKNINQGLIDIGITDFCIEKYDEELYRIIRNNADTKIFSSLSEGEKMIISFLYFRELLRGKSNSTEGQLKKIAIIDDPVSSLSHIFVYNIGRLLKFDFFNAPHIDQIFVLTHSLYFFYELTETNPDKRKDTQNLFRLVKNSEGSSLTSMKYEEIQNDYQSYWSVINDEKQPPALIANCMRNILEYFFNFVQKAALSEVTQFKELKENRFQSFIRYINRESHSLGQNIFDFKEFNYNDFKDALRHVFEATGYGDHYKKMSRIRA